MLYKFKFWYQSRMPLQQLGLSFLFNFILWIALSYIGNIIFLDIDKETVKHRVFHAMWMSFWWTLFFKWNLVRLVFSPKPKSPLSN